MESGKNESLDCDNYFRNNEYPHPRDVDIQLMKNTLTTTSAST
jgi:hypothetical protein